MINVIFKTIVIMLFTNMMSIAQTGFDLLENNRLSNNDSLIINRESGQKIKLIWNYRKNIQKNVPWEELLSDFQRDFQKVAKDIPDYDYYNIKYDTKSLVVDELVGRETFNVKEENGIEYVKSNSCRLVNNNIRMIIEFNNLNELLDPSLQLEIKKAIAQVKNKFYFSFISSERHYFDVGTNSLVKPKTDISFFIPVGVQMGLLRNEPYIEFRPGLGIKADNRLYFSANLNIISSYNTENQSTEYDSYIGFSTGTVGTGLSSEFAVKISDGIESFEDIALRAGLNYKTRNGITLGIQYYISDPRDVEVNNGVDFGFSIGFGF